MSFTIGKGHGYTRAHIRHVKSCRFMSRVENYLNSLEMLRLELYVQSSLYTKPFVFSLATSNFVPCYTRVRFNCLYFFATCIKKFCSKIVISGISKWQTDEIKFNPYHWMSLYCAWKWIFADIMYLWNPIYIQLFWKLIYWTYNNPDHCTASLVWPQQPWLCI
jgi:hypothetical protein